MNDFQKKSYALLQLNMKSKILGAVSPFTTDTHGIYSHPFQKSSGKYS